eukprot:gene589-2011_t
MGSSTNGNREAALKLRQYTYRALTCKGTDNTAYNDFLREFRSLRKRNEKEHDEATELMLTNLILALLDCVSVVKERKHDKMVSEVLGIQLWRVGNNVQNAVVELVTSLVVANAAFTHTCLQMLIFSFLPPPGSHANGGDNEGNGTWEQTHEAVAAHAVVLGAMQKVLALVPTAPTRLLPLIVQHLPYKLRDRDTQCLYLRAVFSIAEAKSGAAIRDGLLTAAVEHLLSLDVEIRWEDIVDVPTGEEEEGETESEDDQDMFELEGMNEADFNCTPEELEQRALEKRLKEEEKQQGGRGGFEGAKPEEEAEASTSGRPPVDRAANKLDSMMELTFQHLAHRCQVSEHHMQLWDVLLGIFERSILNTHRSKFTQFLIFFVCMQHPKSYSRAFIDFLITRLQDARHPMITRSACAAYLASFLARAAFIPETLVVQALSRLTDFCQEYARSVGASDGAKSPSYASIARQGGGQSNPVSTTQHQVFYASVQAILYVLCYHLEPLMGVDPHAAAKSNTPAGPKEILQAKTVASLVRDRISPLLAHPRMAPLNVCLPSVVTEFKHQASTLGLLDLSTLVPSDDLLRRSQRPLEMFFPFDPYLLQRSSRFLALPESYVHWRHGHRVPVQAEEEGSDESGDEGEEDSDNVDELDDELEGLSLEGSDDSDGSSSNSESESGDRMGTGLVPKDGVLTQPGMGAAGLAARRLNPYRGGLPPRHASPAMLMRNGRGIYSGNKHGRSVDDDGRSMLLSVMGASYSPNASSTGDVTPTGTSPVLVDYAYPGSLSGKSPMSMSVRTCSPPSGMHGVFLGNKPRS